MHKRKILITILLLSSALLAGAQLVVTDPVLTALTAVNGAVEHQALKDIKKRQQLIIQWQMATAAATKQVEKWQQKLFKGLTQVNGVVHNAMQLKNCMSQLKEFYENERKMMKVAAECKNPLVLAFAIPSQREAMLRAQRVYAVIAEIVLKGDEKMLLDTGERLKILTRLEDELTILNWSAFAAYWKVQLVAEQGIIESLNPFKHLINRDNYFANQIIKRYKVK